MVPSFLFAQKNTGKILFTEEVKFEFELPEEMAHMKDRLPSSQKFERELLFTEMSSLWKNAEAIENEHSATFDFVQIQV